MFELSPLVTAARAPARAAPARSRSSRSNPDPSICVPGQSAGRRRKARDRLSMMETVWLCSVSSTASPDPTRPQPTMTTCTAPCNTAWPRRTTHGMWLPDDVSEVPVPRAGEAVLPGEEPPAVPGVARARGSAPGRHVAPEALPSPDAVDLPENARYRFKNFVLGPPIASERQSVERLGKPTALAVLSSDVISSSAYATEQILLPLVKVVGVR